MAIHIIDDKPDIYLTRSEHDRLAREYVQFCMFCVNPMSFEDYVLMRLNPGHEKRQHISTGEPPPVMYTITC